jgi:hypothetical protein
MRGSDQPGAFGSGDFCLENLGRAMARRFYEQELAAGIQTSGTRRHGRRWRDGLVNHMQRKRQVAPLVVEAKCVHWRSSSRPGWTTSFRS